MVKIMGVGSVNGESVQVAELGGTMYLLTPCCGASGKGSVADPDNPAVVCRSCYNEVDPAFGAAVQVADATACEIFENRYQVVMEDSVVEEIRNESIVEDETTEPSSTVDPKDLQAAVARVRKEMGLSRRALADSIGWTESRVWYLEQPGVRLDVQRNVEDLGTLQQHMEKLKAKGWTKPTVKTVAAKATKKDEGWFTKDQVDELLAASTKGVADLRAKHADELATLKQLVESLIEDAKARKASTKALVQVLGTVQDMVWES